MEVDIWVAIGVISLVATLGYLTGALMAGAGKGDYYAELIGRLAEEQRRAEKAEEELNIFRTRVRNGFTSNKTL